MENSHAIALLYWACGAAYSYTWLRNLPHCENTASWKKCVLILNSMVGWPFLGLAELLMRNEWDVQQDPLVKSFEQGYDEAMRDAIDIPDGADHMVLDEEQAILFSKAMEDILGCRMDGSPLGDKDRFDATAVWLTGLSGSGKSTVASEIRMKLCKEGRRCCILDGDVLRTGLCSDLGFEEDDRMENLRRAAEVAKILIKRDYVVLCAFITPFEAGRGAVKAVLGDDMMLVHLSTPLEVCEERDPKGLYARARAGEIENFTGVGQRYEDPADAAVVLDTSKDSVEACAEKILEKLKERSLTSGEEPSK
jgi:adenylyl-sulfate kinase